jgi:two-component system, NarL family, sensor kinase
MHKNPEIYFVTIIGIILGLLLVGFIVTILFLYQRRQHRQEQEMDKLKDRYEKELLRSQLEIQENTFITIAQELHDNIGQMLSVVKLSLSALPLENGHPAYQQVKNSQQVLHKAIYDLSNLTKSLHTDRIAQIGLAESIQFELLAVKKAGILRVQFHTKGTESPLNEQKAIFLFRIFQESLNNILKHSQASEVIVDLQYLEDQFILEIKDNGIGFDVSQKQEFATSSSGVGLKNLFSRAKLIGADLSIKSEPGKGTVILIRLPLHVEQ